MAFAETANLAVKLTLGGNFTSQMAKARGQLRGLDKDSSRAYKAGAQIGTGIKRSAFIAVAALGTLTGVLAIAVKEGQDAANVQKIYAQAIKNSGKVTADNVAALNAQQAALLNLAGVDDELIKSEQTRLIQMGLSGKATEKLTPLILDAAKATGKDLLTVTIAAGKAANGNAGALQRLGIMVDKVRFKADPLAETIRVLNKRFGGTTQALSGSFDTRLAVLQERLKNIREDVGIKLLPALTRIVDVVGAKLVPAFGAFVDRILPDINKGLDEFSNALSNGGAENAIRGITDALGPMIDLVKVAAAPVKAIVGAFLSLPKEVQTVLVGAFAVNKLTGGLVTNAAGGIVESLAKAFIGGIKAPLVNVEGGVVNVGGVPGVGGGVAGAAGGLSKLSKVFLVGEAIGLAVAVHQVWEAINADTTAHAQAISDQTDKFIASQPPTGDLITAVDAVNTGIRDLKSNPLNVLVQGEALTKLEAMRVSLNAALGPGGAGKAKDDLVLPRKTGTGKATDDLITAIHANTSAVRGLNPTTGKPHELSGSLLSQIIGGGSPGRGKAADDVALANALSPTNKAVQETAGATRQGSANIVGAIRSSRPIVSTSVVVNVSANSVTKSVTVQNRYGPGTGSRGSDGRYHAGTGGA